MALAIDARGVTKVFGAGPLGHRALDAVDLQVEAGELVMLVGPSGSGKTTLLSILGCVMTADAGVVSLFDHDVTALRASELPLMRRALIGLVFQGHNLIASAPAWVNIALVLEVRGVAPRRAREEALALLARVGLGDRADAMPSELSGGQRQRVAVARAVAGSPPLVLADEPTASLDAVSGHQVTELLVSLSRERGATVVVVTHDPRIFDLADRVVTIEDGRVTKAAA